MLKVMQMRFLLVLLGAGWLAVAQAEIYKHVDASGTVTYTDYPVSGATRLHIGSSGAHWSTHASAKQVSVHHGEDDIAIGHVDAKTQKKRDELRRRVLIDELDAERQALAKARAAEKSAVAPFAGETPTSRTYLDRQSHLTDAVKLHTDNIAALKRELARLR